MTRVLVTTDASRNRQTGLSTWAYSAVRRGQRYSGGGVIHRRVDSNEAEVCAIVNALHRLYCSGVVARDDEVHIHSDSMRAITVLNTVFVPRSMTRLEVEARAHYIYLCQKLNLTVVKRLVHDRDNFTLRIVDYNARSARRDVERRRQDDDAVRGIRTGVWDVHVGRTKYGERRKARNKKEREDRSGTRHPRFMAKTSEWRSAARNYTLGLEE